MSLERALWSHLCHLGLINEYPNLKNIFKEDWNSSFVGLIIMGTCLAAMFKIIDDSSSFNRYLLSIYCAYNTVGEANMVFGSKQIIIYLRDKKWRWNKFSMVGNGLKRIPEGGRLCWALIVIIWRANPRREDIAIYPIFITFSPFFIPDTSVNPASTLSPLLPCSSFHHLLPKLL